MDVLLNNSNNTGWFDWQWAAGDVVTGSGLTDLQTAVITSLFSDASATLDFILQDGSTNRRGCWADDYTEYPTGSNLWQLFRASISSQTLLQARKYCQNALAWMTEQGVAAAVGVQCYWLTGQSLGIAIEITQPVTNTLIPLKFNWAWNTQQVTLS